MEAVSSLDIIRDTANMWHFERNSTGIPNGASGYIGTFNNNYVSFQQKFKGGNIYNKVPYSVIRYIDNYNSAEPVTPSSPLALMTLLVQEGFFGESSDSSGAVTAFTQLVDTFPNYFGKGGQVVIVSPDEVGLITSTIANPSFTTLNDWLGGDLQPNSYLLTNNLGTGIVQSPVLNIINRPPGFSELFIYRKGFQIDGETITPNTEPYELEVGELCSAIFIESGRVYEYPKLQYTGGPTNLLLNFNILASRKKIYPSAYNELSTISLICDSDGLIQSDYLIGLTSIEQLSSSAIGGVQESGFDYDADLGEITADYLYSGSKYLITFKP